MWRSLVENWRTLTNEQKISVCLLGFCGVIAVGLSMMRVRANVLEPFLVSKSEIVSAKELIGSTPEEDLAKQKRTDTDGDTLSDWDEENVYKTNPNLKDTCGDGMADNVRIATGKGLECLGAQTGTVETGSASGTAPTKLYPDVGTSASLPVDLNTILPGAGTVDPNAVEQVMPRDPAVIRAALKEKVDEAKLKTLSDEQLLELYDEAMKAQTAPTGL